MTWIWSALTLGGLALVVWSMRSLPPGTSLAVVPIVERATGGPYRWMNHPMYVGNALHLAGLAGLAAGFWNALAIGLLAELIMREWATRETTVPGGRESHHAEPLD